MTNIFLLDESNNMSSQHFCCSQNISLGKIIKYVESGTSKCCCFDSWKNKKKKEILLT
jgi:hypothetical protein